MEGLGKHERLSTGSSMWDERAQGKERAYAAPPVAYPCSGTSRSAAPRLGSAGTSATAWCSAPPVQAPGRRSWSTSPAPSFSGCSCATGWNADAHPETRVPHDRLLRRVHTFSTFSYETVALLEDGQWGTRHSTPPASLVLWLGATLLRFIAARGIISAREGL
jgi:hypothetical protein